MIYTSILFVHSWWRWAVLALVLGVFARTLSGWRSGREWARGDERLHLAMISALDLQLALGLLLYAWLSPFTRAFFAHAALGMKQPGLRFFGVEHIFGMLVAITVAHVGRRRARKVQGPLRHRRVFWFTLASLLVIAASIPWPFLRYGRPLWRTMAALVPPNPDDVERTARSSLFLGAPRTTSSGISGS